MIVKLQVPLCTNEPTPLALLYNKDRSYDVMVPVDQSMLDWLKGRPKAYFEIKLHFEGFGFTIVKEAEWQNW